MSGGLVDELHEVPLDRENQDLKEIIEIAFQITAQLEVENIAKNVAWSFTSKFQPESVTFLLPGEADEAPPRIVCYRGVKLEETPPPVPPIAAMLAFLEKDEYSQVTFQYFRENYADTAFVAALEALASGMIVPLRTDKGVIGALLLGNTGEPSSLAEVQYITRIARFAAISIENAQLVENIKTLVEEKRRQGRLVTPFVSGINGAISTLLIFADLTTLHKKACVTPSGIIIFL
jgi:transcriptional regulator with GAF, ATPase, and Fis domain